MPCVSLQRKYNDDKAKENLINKKVYRVYEAIHFNRRKPLRKRLPARVKNPLVTPDQENVTWSMDFVTDVLQSNRKFHTGSEFISHEFQEWLFLADSEQLYRTI